MPCIVGRDKSEVVVPVRPPFLGVDGCGECTVAGLRFDLKLKRWRGLNSASR